MYDELKAKCDTMAEELNAAAEEMRGSGDYNTIQLYHAIVAAKNKLANVSSIIDTYFSK